MMQSLLAINGRIELMCTCRLGDGLPRLDLLQHLWCDISSEPTSFECHNDSCMAVLYLKSASRLLAILGSFDCWTFR